MKILIIRNYPSYMDVKNNTYNIQEIGLAKALIRKGNICDIVFWTFDEEKIVDYIFDGNNHIKIYYKKGINILKNAIYIGIEKLIQKYDIVQTAEYNQLQSWLLSKKYPEKTVIYHGPYYCDFNKRYNAVCRVSDMFMLRAYKKNNTPFMVKSNLAAKFLEDKGISKKNITVCGVGIDLGALEHKESSHLPQQIKQINKIENKKKLLYIGRLEPRRNIIFLLEILKNLKEKDEDVVLIIIGTGEKGYCEQVFDYIKLNNLSDNVLYIDKMEQKYLSYVYDLSDIFILPTKYEIFGMVLLEAMYFGKPVITTYNGGSDILIESGEDGIIIHNEDVNVWSDEIVKMFNNNYLGKKAHEKIKNKYTWDSLANKFINTYNEFY